MSDQAVGGDCPQADTNEGLDTGWFETVASTTRYTGYSRVISEEVRTPDGTIVTREIVDHDDAVGVVALTSDGEVVLLKQYRQPLRSYLLEIPAGTLDIVGEGVEQAARRELAEEAGMQTDTLEHLTTFANSAGWSNERTHLYLARDVRPAARPDGFVADAEEADMEVVLLPFGEVAAQARRGRLEDAKTALGVLLAAEHLAT